MSHEDLNQLLHYLGGFNEPSMNVLRELHKRFGMKPLLDLKELGFRGGSIIVIFREHCGEDYEKMVRFLEKRIAERN
jgi:hypothetical protein